MRGPGVVMNISGGNTPMITIVRGFDARSNVHIATIYTATGQRLVSGKSREAVEGHILAILKRLAQESSTLEAD